MEDYIMKKYILFLLTALLLVACGNELTEEEKFVPGKPVSFEIVKYEEKIAPIYMQQVPHIAYAINEAQLNVLKQKFEVEDIEIDMEKYMALFVVTQSDSCGVIADGVYDNDNKLSVQLIAPASDNCEVDPVDHTFVLQVAHADYEKVQLYNGKVLKSSMDIKEKQ